jgi:hypothetical protein
MTLTGASTLDLQRYSDSVASLTLNSGQVIASGGTITSAGAVTVNGADNLIGQGATVAFSGTAVVNGNLQVQGSLKGAVRVSIGGTLSGVGSVGALTANTGATLTPGNPTTGIGTLSVGDLTLQNSVTLSLAITHDASGVAGVNYAQLSAQALNLSAITGIAVSLENVSGDGSIFSPNSNYMWRNVITTTGLSGFDASLFTISLNNFYTGNLPGSFMFVHDTLNVNALDLQYLAIPEPQTWELLAGGVGVIGWMLRRRRFWLGL